MPEGNRSTYAGREGLYTRTASLVDLSASGRAMLADIQIIGAVGGDACLTPPIFPAPPNSQHSLFRLAALGSIVRFVKRKNRNATLYSTCREKSKTVANLLRQVSLGGSQLQTAPLCDMGTT